VLLTLFTPGNDAYSVFDVGLLKHALEAPRRYNINSIEESDGVIGPRMPQPRLLLVGPRGSGKSTLAASLKVISLLKAL
jgi:polynucleotide 5'-kinase involved in rRNA processing